MLGENTQGIYVVGRDRRMRVVGEHTNHRHGENTNHRHTPQAQWWFVGTQTTEEEENTSHRQPKISRIFAMVFEHMLQYICTYLFVVWFKKLQFEIID
ncbi:MAG: hypothetical protein IPP29_05490 [Bacteroidetes bacterium]|nr:hypothetical protein [Bacteroidota bacterium]